MFDTTPIPLSCRLPYMVHIFIKTHLQPICMPGSERRFQLRVMPPIVHNGSVPKSPFSYADHDGQHKGNFTALSIRIHRSLSRPSNFHTIPEEVSTSDWQASGSWDVGHYKSTIPLYCMVHGYNPHWKGPVALYFCYGSDKLCPSLICYMTLHTSSMGIPLGLEPHLIPVQTTHHAISMVPLQQ